MLFAGSADFDLIQSALTTNSVFGYSTRVLVNPEDPASDSYSWIMRSTYASTNPAGGLLPSPMTVTLSSFVHFDIAATLGIPTNGSGEVLSLNPYFLGTDFTLDGLTTLWES